MIRIKRMLLVNWIKTIWFNFVHFDSDIAVKLPIWFGFGVKLYPSRHKGNIEINKNNILPGMIQIGTSNGSFRLGAGNKSYFSFSHDAKIIFNGSCYITKGATIQVGTNGILTIGDKFSANPRLFIKCHDSIQIGDDCIFGWDISIMDDDGHQIFDKNNDLINPSQKIYVGNHVWASSNVTILKGASIPNDSVLGFGTIVSKKFEKDGVVIAGTPARIVRESIVWKK